MLKRIMNLRENKYFLYGVLLVMIIAIVIEGFFIYELFNREVEVVETLVLEEKKEVEDVDTKEELPSKILVDVKGAVKKTGVYELEEGAIVNDVIKLAGGLKSNAYTNNINLSKKVANETVIYVYTKSEYNKLKTNTTKQEITENNNYNITSQIESGTSIITENNVDTSTPVEEEVVEQPQESTSTLINLNTATKEELMTLSGIGESKAIAIIEYRETNGGFKTIDELKNISGIGDATFEKLKNSITV